MAMRIKKNKSKMAVLMRNASPAVTVLSSIPCLLLVTGEDVEAAPIQARLHLRTQSEDGQQLGCHLAALE